MSSQVIRESNPAPPKVLLAKTLQFSRGMFYRQSKINQKDKMVIEAIERVWEEDDTLGHKKLAPILGMGKNRIKRVMGKYGLKPRQRKHQYHYHGKTNLPPAPNLANDQEYRDNLDTGVIYSDIFEFKLADYCKIRGCFALLRQTKQVLAMVFDYSMSDALVTSTIDHLTVIDSQTGEQFVIYHSDQGKQYGSKKARAKLLEKGLVQSMSRPGTPTDNPFAERFVSTFKHAVCRRKRYYSFGEFLQAAASWIDFYNNRRPHEGADNLPPNVFAKKWGWPVVPKITNLTVH